MLCFITKRKAGSPINRDFRGNDRFDRGDRQREVRINNRIRAREVRLIDEDGAMIGVMPLSQAQDMARDRDLDLF